MNQYTALLFGLPARQKGWFIMGKSLNGKELGKGISQRKDGLYQARFTNRFGKRQTLTPHTFRHTFVTRCIETGVQPKTLQKLLGHGSLQMTMDLYCHVTQDTLFEEIEKYGNASSC